MLSEELKLYENKGIIFDGYPRNLTQARTLDHMLEETGLCISKVLFLDVPENVLLERLSGRRVCKKCGALFHMGTNPPKKDKQCDLCGGALIQRKDDTIGVVQERLAVYRKATLPLKQHYERKVNFLK